MDRVSALLVTFDGVVMDNLAFVRERTHTAFRSLGLTFTTEDDDPGRPLWDLVRTAAAREGAEISPPQYLRAERPYVRAYADEFRFSGMRMIPETLALLDACAASGLRTAIVSARMIKLNALLRDHETIRRTVTIVDGGAASSNAPFAARLHLAARRCHARPDQCCGIAVTPSGIRAFADAGMCPIGIKTTPDSAIALGPAGAARTFVSLRDLTPVVLHDLHHDWHRGHLGTRNLPRNHRWSATAQNVDDPGIP